MRPEYNAGSSQKPRPGVAGWLNDCLMDGDAAAVRGARRLRRRSLAVSLVVQFGIIATVALVPVFAHVADPLLTRSFIPLPPYARGMSSQAAHSAHQRPGGSSHQPTNATRFPVILRQPDRIPPTIDTTRGSTLDHPPTLDVGPGNGRGVPDGVLWGIEPLDPMKPSVAVREPKLPVTKAGTRAVHQSEPIQQAMLIYRIDPVYPPLARQTHLEGTVRLHAIVGRDGEVRDLEVLSGPALFVRETLDAVRRWRYRPTILNGEPVEVDTYITVIFQLSH